MRHRPRLGKVVGRGSAVAAVTGQPPLGRLDAEQAAEAGRYANGSAAVAARGQRAQPCRQRGRRAPPLEPPGVRSIFQGLRQASPSLFSVGGVMPNSGALVLPSTIAPAWRTRSTTIESISVARSRKTAEPMVVFMSLVASRSFMEIGIPCSGPSVSPRSTASWATRASARA